MTDSSPSKSVFLSEDNNGRPGAGYPGRAVLDGAPGLYEAYMLASNLSDGIDYVIRPKLVGSPLLLLWCSKAHPP